MRNVMVPGDVAALLGADRLEALFVAGMAYRCAGCRAYGRLGEEPVEVRVMVYEDDATTVVQFVHGRCGSGGVRRSAGAAPMPAATDVTGLPVVMQTLFGPWAALFVEHAMARLAEQVPGQGDEFDVLLSGLCLLGMSPVGTVRGVPPPAPGFRVILPSGAELGSVHHLPSGVVLMAPLHELDFPDEWAAVAAERGDKCALYVLSRVALRAVHERGDEGSWFLSAVTAAARAGRVVGAVADVTR